MDVEEAPVPQGSRPGLGVSPPYGLLGKPETSLGISVKVPATHGVGHNVSYGDAGGYEMNPDDEELARQMKAAERVMRENRAVLRKLAKNELEPDSEEPVAKPIR